MVTYGVPVLITAERKIVQVNKARTSLVIMNISAANALFVRDSAGVSPENAIRIPPLGAVSYRIPEDDPTTAFWALATGATIVAIVQEQMGTKPLPVRVV
jgi:hypothetical protein